MIDNNSLFAMADQAATRYGIPTDLFRRLIKQESGWNQGAVSSKGAIGLGQLMPNTAQELGVDPNDPAQNLDGAARYLSQHYQTFGDWPTALAAYNSGAGNVRKYGGIPPFSETRQYVNSIAGGSTNPTPPSFSNASALGNGPQSLTQSLGFGSERLPMMMRSIPEQRGDVGTNPVSSVGSRLPDPPKTQAEQMLGEMNAPDWMQKLGKWAKGGRSVDVGAHMTMGLGAAGGVPGYKEAEDPSVGVTRLLSLLNSLGGGVQSRRRS